MNYSKVIELDRITLADCVSMFENPDEMATFDINNGRITNINRKDDLL